MSWERITGPDSLPVHFELQLPDLARIREQAPAELLRPRGSLLDAHDGRMRFTRRFGG